MHIYVYEIYKDVERYLIIYIKTEPMEKTQKKLQTGLLLLMKSPFTNLSNSIQQNFILQSKNLC